MTRAVVGRAKWSAFGAVALCAATLLVPAPAAADPGDDAFVAKVAGKGIDTSDRSGTLAMAHNVCAGLDKGESQTVVVLSLVRATEMSAKQSGFFVGAAVSSFCPQHSGVAAAGN